MSALALLSAVCLLLGAGWGILGVVGVLRFPDFFARLHASGMTDTGCAGLVILGLMLQADGWQTVAKLIMILFFLLFTTPTASYVLAKAAVRGGELEALDAARHD